MARATSRARTATAPLWLALALLASAHPVVAQASRCVEIFDALGTGHGLGEYLGTARCVRDTERPLVEMLGGGDHETYYPPDWGSDDLRAKVRLVTEVLAHVLTVYNDLAHATGTEPVRRTTTIFVEGVGEGWPVFVAVRDVSIPLMPCPILFNADAVAEANLTGTVDRRLRFITAHELFHCFQLLNFGPPTSDPHPWWIEGSASYFANVAYPTLDVEHEDTQLYDPRLQPYLHLGPEEPRPAEPDTLLSYSTSLFFQALANEIGEVGVIDVLRRLPTGAEIEQNQRALSRVPKMEELFHRFAQHYHDQTIADTGGGYVPQGRELEPLPLLIDGVDPQHAGLRLQAPPFHIYPYRLTLPRGRDYRFDGRREGAFGSSSAKSLTWGTDWGSLPSELSAACDLDEEYVLLLTSAAGPEGNSDPFTQVLEISSAPRDDCDCTKPGGNLTPEEYGRGRAGCFLRCQDRCWCESRHMWGDRPITLAECHTFWPDGKKEFSPYVKGTVCHRMIEVNQTKIPAAQALGAYCVVECGKACRGVPLLPP